MLTLGVEEEFLLTDPRTGVPNPRSEAVLDQLEDEHRTHIVQELLYTQLETVSGVHGALGDLRADLMEARVTLNDAGARCGVRVLSVGAPIVIDTEPPPVVRSARSTRIVERFSGAIRGYQCCGCHVHVGVADRDLAVGVVNHLRPWLPTLVALGANSPFSAGRDSGYCSWRIVEQSRFPGFGLPPFTRSAREYDDTVARLVECGVLVDDHMSFWLARPSVAYPTVEVRAADAAATVDDAVLQAALSRALVGTALRDLGAGIEASPIDDQVGAAAVWAAARHGLSGPGIDAVRERSVPATQLLTQMLAHVREALDVAGDSRLVRELLAARYRAGSGAERQREAARTGMNSLLSMVADQTAPGNEPERFATFAPGYCSGTEQPRRDGGVWCG
ncbi:carboxylate-amine ligase [Rhodococcus maanshanensis]|uniref:Putative glutamate--cysteine ligase 2 n=1 Tax=Rhodococcus maanshanensis TaxID=183556 RepID=A0A1H7LUV3_9NOCA|nr:glutamate--cysteine ligase [Rhodococcus maanshanensis]SEL02107.1 carboxylate-amine ligase [Rhodococcus maanshanensis]